MKRFEIDIEEKMIRRYLVEAETYEEALEKIEEGDHIDCWDSGALDEMYMDTADLISEEDV